MTQRVNEFVNRQRRLRRSARLGFTLTELLVVISIIILVLALAVPIFSVLRGGRSVDAGQNVMSATLQRARSRAIGMQSRRGIFFFDDQVSGRTGMLLVKLDDPVISATAPDTAPNVLELDTPDVEPEYLPPGVGAAFLLPPFTAGGTTTEFRPTGLIVFDGLGRTESVVAYTPFASPGTTATARYPNGTNLSQQYAKNIGPTVMDPSNGLGSQANTNTNLHNRESSQVAFVLYDRRIFAEQDATGSTPGISFGATQKNWLDQNGTAVVINRYNGTLIRGE